MCCCSHQAEKALVAFVRLLSPVPEAFGPLVERKVIHLDPDHTVEHRARRRVCRHVYCCRISAWRGLWRETGIRDDASEDIEANYKRYMRGSSQIAMSGDRAVVTTSSQLDYLPGILRTAQLGALSLQVQ